MQEVSGKQPGISVEPLGQRHDRKGFSCGVPTLDDYLRRRVGQGVGQFLLVDALYRSLLQASQIAAHAVVVDAKDASAERFYESFGFLRFTDHEGRLFLPMKTVSELFRE